MTEEEARAADTRATRPALVPLSAFCAALVPSFLFPDQFRFTGRSHGLAAAAMREGIRWRAEKACHALIAN